MMVEAAQKRLKSALKKGEPREVGWAHLDVAHALFQRATDPQEFIKDSKGALLEADKAIDSFSGIPDPAGIASGHLARASIYTQLIDPEHDEPKRAAEVDRALTACLAAQEAVNAEGITAGQIFDIYSSISVLFLLLRDALDNEEFQDQLDGLINQNSILLGEIVAEDVKLRSEGGSLLLGSDLMGLLAELDEDEEEQKELRKTQSMLALQAARWFVSSSDPDLMTSALEKYQSASSKLEEKSAPTSEVNEGTGQCPECGKSNSPAAKFCDQCGTSLTANK
jgi:hypothetical protein